MRNIINILHYTYEGPLAKVCEDFISEKRALGYSYNTEAKHLREFSRFSVNHDFPINELPESVVNGWIARRPGETDRSQYSRLQLIKVFAEYMQRLGYNAFCPTKELLGKIQWYYTPYIFTHDEIRRFFNAADSLEYQRHSSAPRKHIVMPLLFRMLYCCGLRVSEATNLRCRDVDFSQGIITVIESKFGKTRYVPLSEEMTELYRNYADKYTIGPDSYFFRAPDDGPYGSRGIYSVFRDLLWAAGISHGGRGKGPRVHDFRHTFAVHCLEQMVSEGHELTAALPRLSSYLGHEDLAATERYLRLTAELYPEITSVLDERYGFILQRKEVSNENH